jgi:hypothetical protein
MNVFSLDQHSHIWPTSWVLTLHVSNRIGLQLCHLELGMHMVSRTVIGIRNANFKKKN